MSFKFPNGSQGYVEVQAVWRTVPYLLSSPLWHHVCVNYWHDINIPRSLWLVFLLSKKRWKTWSYSTISPNVCFFLSQGAFTAFTLAQVIKIQWPHRQEVNFNIRGSVRVFLRWCEQSHGASFLFIAKSLVLYLNTCRELLWCIYFSGLVFPSCISKTQLLCLLCRNTNESKHSQTSSVHLQHFKSLLFLCFTF